MIPQQQRPEAPRLQFKNPFALRVGQVMTGFGVGCGVGIGFGRQLNLDSALSLPLACAIPVVGQITGEAARAFGGLGRQVHGLVRKLGVKNLEVGIGCGVGLGHGFGIGVTLKPGAAQELKGMIEQGLSVINGRMRSAMGAGPVNRSQGVVPNTTSSIFTPEQNLPISSLMGESGTNQTGRQLQSLMPNTSSISATTPQPATNSQFGEDNEVDRLQAENSILRALLRHQEQIEELKKKNTALKQLLVEELKVPLNAVECLNNDDEMQRRTTDKGQLIGKCFDCRRQARRRT